MKIIWAMVLFKTKLLLAISRYSQEYVALNFYVHRHYVFSCNVSIYLCNNIVPSYVEISPATK